MSDMHRYRFRAAQITTEVALPFSLDAICRDYDALTSKMVRQQPPPQFSRDEWGYLVSVLRGAHLRAVFDQVFGSPVPQAGDLPDRLAFAKSEIAIWLPNNVSLLGPLSVAFCLLSGARVHAKAGSRAENLTAGLQSAILDQLDPGSVLAGMWRDRLQTAQFARDDPRNAAWSQTADARIFFGSDAAALAVEALPHKPGTPFYAFADHSSLIWADAAALDEAALTTLLRVFRVYGKFGCTSPQRLVLIDGTAAQADAVARDLQALADRDSHEVPVHIASDNFMAAQVARARGGQAYQDAKGGMVFVTGADPAETAPGLMSLAIDTQSLDQAVAMLPRNIQTIGHAAPPERLQDWARALAGTAALRFVPIRQMHHFGPFWDGQPFWQGLFRMIDIKG